MYSPQEKTMDWLGLRWPDNELEEALFRAFPNATKADIKEAMSQECDEDGARRCFLSLN
jgi:hypothetical protein